MAMSVKSMTSRSRVARGQTRNAWQRGLSLVELMVALGLGAFITVGIIQMFTANRETYDVNMGQARLQENARFALDFLASPVRMAGFAGCFSDSGDILNVLNPVAGQTPFEFDFDESVLGHEATSDGVWSPTLDNLPAAIPTADIASGTDVVVLRAADTQGIRLTADMPSSSAVIKTSMPVDLGPYDDGAVLMISDCEKAAVFQVTNAQTTTGGTELNIVHNAGSAGVSPGNSQKELTRDGSAFRSDANVYAAVTRIFYVAPGAGTNNRGDTPLSLWRREGNNPPSELVEGIEDLQLLYGVDTDDDGVPNRYRTIQNIADPSEIVTIRVSVTANSVDVVTDSGDGLLRRTFTKTIALRNRV